METFLLRFMRVGLTATGLLLPAIARPQFYIEASLSAAGGAGAQFERRSTLFFGNENSGTVPFGASGNSFSEPAGLHAAYPYLGDITTAASDSRQMGVPHPVSPAVVDGQHAGDEQRLGLAPELRWAGADNTGMTFGPGANEEGRSPLSFAHRSTDFSHPLERDFNRSATDRNH